MSTYTPISTQTLASAAASVSFSGIPQNYTDLVLIADFATLNTNSTVSLRFNGDSGNNYSMTRLYGNGSSATSDRATNTSSTQVGFAGDGSRSVQRFQIQSYSNTTTNKTVIGRADGAGILTMATAGLWRNTAAITSIDILALSATNIPSGSTFTLYGIGSGSPKAFGGDIVTTDGTYWYHAFRNSGVFSPVQNLTCDILVVAGGGGGGGAYGGGGGAGGFRVVNSFLDSTVNYTVTIGGGGAASTGTYPNGSRGGKGVNSSVSGSGLTTITSTGGGGGGTHNTANAGATGGSGGGASLSANGAAGNEGGHTPVEGNAGANGISNTQMGGGGGAGSAATNQTGGAGNNSYSSWATATSSGASGYYAGGGGAGRSPASNNSGSGGLGGGGAGGNGGSQGTSGTANTGGGGGGSGEDYSGTGSTGGSGIVIVRYPV
jgi:hypothetical protein